MAIITRWYRDVELMRHTSGSCPLRRLVTGSLNVPRCPFVVTLLQKPLLETFIACSFHFSSLSFLFPIGSSNFPFLFHFFLCFIDFSTDVLVLTGDFRSTRTTILETSLLSSNRLGWFFPWGDSTDSRNLAVQMGSFSWSFPDLNFTRN